MTPSEFQRLGMLLSEQQVYQVTGLAYHTIRKYVDCGVLRRVRPEPMTHGKLLKVQIAAIVGISVEDERLTWEREPLLLRDKAVRRWTGYSCKTINRLVEAGSLQRIKLPGGVAAYRKHDVGELIGLNGIGQRRSEQGKDVAGRGRAIAKGPRQMAQDTE
jgi:predicted site-specific integrase-resolvase